MRECFAAPKKETRASLLIDDEAARSSARERKRRTGNVLIDTFALNCVLAVFFLFVAVYLYTMLLFLYM